MVSSRDGRCVSNEGRQGLTKFDRVSLLLVMVAFELFSTSSISSNRTLNIQRLDRAIFQSRVLPSVYTIKKSLVIHMSQGIRKRL